MSSIDVVIPCYSYGRYLSEAVHSVLSQGVEAVRVLIIDDASPDDSAEIAGDLARQDARITFHRHPVNRGHIRTYNEGIEWAGADCLLLLSADDYLLPGSLKRALGLMDSIRKPALSSAMRCSSGATATRSAPNRRPFAT